MVQQSHQSQQLSTAKGLVTNIGAAPSRREIAMKVDHVTKHYKTITLPTMSTGANDMAYLRAKGIQCYGIGPALDVEDGPKGYGAHSDQERILESELYRFVRFNFDVVMDLVRKK